MTPTVTQNTASMVRCPPRSSERVVYEKYIDAFMSVASFVNTIG